jgi:adenosylhomocysteine nucleosidase
MKPPSIAVIAALPREIAGLVRGVAADRELLRRGVSLYILPQAVVVAAGMGAQRAALAVEAARNASPVAMLISAGLAGACTPELVPGTVAEAALTIDTRTGERYTSSELLTGLSLATSDNIADINEKSRLAAAYGAALVDMEAATVARLALAHGLAFRAIKAVSDACDFELESLARFAGERGQFRTAAFALHTALRPWHWNKAARLGRDSGRALKALTAALQQILQGEAV